MIVNNSEKSGIYVHIPFCVKKCNYCAFVSGKSTEESRAQYIEALLGEISLRADRERACDTIFIGGGTPSLLTPQQIAAIIDAIHSSFAISDDAEITMEANPATLTRESLAGYKAAGVTRLSLGVQSMDDGALKTLGRIHSSQDVMRDFALARELGYDNINLDLMFAIPGTTLQDSIDSLKSAMALNPDHISYYSLQLEQGTKFYCDFENGSFQEIPDDLDREMYHTGRMLLKEAGFEHYEISNFAQPGHQSHHNSKYWSMAEYIGVGLAASTYINSERIVNTSDMAKYKRLIASRELPISEIHRNSQRDTISEAVFTGLRRNFGIRYEDILGSEQEFWNYYQDALEEIRKFEQSGYVILDEQGMRLTNLGIDISNKIMALFV